MENPWDQNMDTTDSVGHTSLQHSAFPCLKKADIHPLLGTDNPLIKQLKLPA